MFFTNTESSMSSGIGYSAISFSTSSNDIDIEEKLKYFEKQFKSKVGKQNYSELFDEIPSCNE